MEKKSTKPQGNNQIIIGLVAGVLICGLIGFLTLAGLLFYRFSNTSTTPASNKPDIQNITISTFDNQTYKLSDYQGKIIVINFWASWAKPCEKEAADLERAWQEYKDDGVLFFGVDYIDTETEAQAYINKWGITYPNGPDEGTKISQTFRISGVPETYIFDKNGKLIKALTGPTDYITLSTIIRQSLDK